jgi:hypothetical protein
MTDEGWRADLHRELSEGANVGCSGLIIRAGGTEKSLRDRMGSEPPGAALSEGNRERN